MHRRSLNELSLALALLLTAVSTNGCGESAGAKGVPVCDEPPDGPSSPTTPNQDVPYDMQQSQRQACTFGTGDLVQSTVGDVPPIPLKHVIVLMMENRSFDHYFSGLANADTTHTSANPDPWDPVQRGKRIAQWHETTVCETGPEGGPNHEWGPSHLQFDNGQMDGFVAASNPNGARAMGYYTEDDIPFYYWLARSFAISDRHFSSLLGPTWPNRLFLVAATSCGYAEGDDTNPLISTNCGATTRNLFTQLTEGGVSFSVFTAGAIPGLGPLPLISSLFFDILALNDVSHFANFDDFRNQASHNTLPDVSLIEPNYESVTRHVGGAPNDDHPPGNIQLGQMFVYQAVAAMMNNPETWSSSALFITYDENGGYYDHVVPPAACEPSEIPISDYRFDRLGFRVPLIVVSPFAKNGYVSHYVTDHTSILRFIQAWKSMGALNKRDANAWPMLDLFDFTKSPAAPPTISDHMPVIDAQKGALCPEQ